MVKYVRCPRCELNYIDEESQEFCDVCLAEIRGAKLKFADLDEDEYIDENTDYEELCPNCGVNHLRPGEKLCDTCKQQQGDYEEDEIDIDKDEEWKNYLEEDEGDLTVDDAEFQDLENGFGEDEEEDEMYEGEDDDPLNDFNDFDDDGLDDDFDDDDDEDDEDDDDF